MQPYSRAAPARPQLSLLLYISMCSQAQLKDMRCTGQADTPTLDSQHCVRQAEAGRPAVEPIAQPASPASSAASLLPGEELEEDVLEEDEAFCTPAVHLLATPEAAAHGTQTPLSAPLVPRLNLGACNAARYSKSVPLQGFYSYKPTTPILRRRHGRRRCGAAHTPRHLQR